LIVSNLGVDDATVSVKVGGFTGVISSPEIVANDGLMVIAPAVVPACKPIWVAPVGNTASVVFAGMVNGTVLPPVENCTEGSGANAAELMDMVRDPVSANGNGADKESPTAGCCSGVTFPLAPVN